jgi:aminoglycoside phosphotransferase (APT) family kinase protein
LSRNGKGFLPERRGVRSPQEIAETLHKTPALVQVRTRCGKTGCRCTTGQLHGPYTVMSWREGTVQRRRYVREEDIPAVRAIIEQRQSARAVERQTWISSTAILRQLAQIQEDIDTMLVEQRKQR